MNRFFFTMLHVLPQKWLSRQAARFACSKWSRGIIPWFARRYRIAVNEAEKDWRDYGSLADFFARKLKPGLRPVCGSADSVVSPVDATISQMGTIREGRLIQAKGVDYSVEQLLGDQTKARIFAKGEFITLYLSPQDYHRIHSPITGRITGYVYWPGKLFPVNDLGVKGIPGLFVRNERVITYLESEMGTVAVVKVGAIIVGSVRLAYAPLVSNRGLAAEAVCLEDGPFVGKGEELGHFQFGSTVILLFEPQCIDWRAGLEPGVRVNMGECIARRK